MRLKKRCGFSLLEVTVAIAIMAIGSAGVLLAVQKGMTMQSRYADMIIMNDLVNISQAVTIYRRLYGTPPKDIDDLVRGKILLGDKDKYRLVEEKGAIIPVRHDNRQDMRLDDFANRR